MAGRDWPWCFANRLGFRGNQLGNRRLGNGCCNAWRVSPALRKPVNSLLTVTLLTRAYLTAYRFFAYRNAPVTRRARYFIIAQGADS